jgi:hypothetical protein
MAVDERTGGPAVTDPFVAGAASAGLFGIYADLAYTLYGATNSSPQTTELFAADRAKTLSKYVYLGHAQALGYGLFGSIVGRTWWPLIASATVGVTMQIMYSHALKAGQSQAPPAAAA